MARLRRVPLVLYSVGLDSDQHRRWFHRACLRFICSTAKSILVRDEFSLHHLKNIGFSQTKVAPDAAFLQPPQIFTAGSKRTGVTIYVAELTRRTIKKVSTSTVRDSYFQSLWNAARPHLLRDETLVVSCSSSGDIEDAQHFAEWLLTHKLWPNIDVRPPTSLENFLSQIVSTRIVISTRMHPLIAAKIYGTPAFAVPLNAKTANMYTVISNANSIDLSAEAARLLSSEIETYFR